MADLPARPGAAASQVALARPTAETASSAAGRGTRAPATDRPSARFGCASARQHGHRSPGRSLNRMAAAPTLKQRIGPHRLPRTGGEEWGQQRRRWSTGGGHPRQDCSAGWWRGSRDNVGGGSSGLRSQTRHPRTLASRRRGSVAAAGRARTWQGDGAHSLTNTNPLVAAQLDLVDHVMMLVAGGLRNGAGRQTSAQGRTSFSTNQLGQRIRWCGRTNAQPGRKVVIGEEGGRYNERLHLSAAAAAAGQTTGAVISGPPFEERGPT